MSWYITENSPVYLDYNATTPLADEVRKSIISGLRYWVNPGSGTLEAEETRNFIADSKQSIGEVLHVNKEEVTITSGGTEANNWVIKSAIEDFRLGKRVGKPHIITSSIDHPSILEPLRHLQEINEIDVTYLPVDKSTGMVCGKDVDDNVNDRTCLVTVMLANNETGVLQPVREIADVTRKRAAALGIKIFLHSDVAQAIGKVDVNIHELTVDAVTVVGHKFYGPRIGALVVRSHLTTRLHPMLFGGGQENGLRSGTENTPMILGLGAAARVASTKLQSFEHHLREIRDYFEEKLKALLPEVHAVHYATSARLPNTSSVAFTSFDGNACQLLERCQGFHASTGAACHTGKISPVLEACGIEKEIASRTVRFSFGRETTKEDVDRVVKELKAIVFFSKYGGSLMSAIAKGQPVPGF